MFPLLFQHTAARRRLVYAITSFKVFSNYCFNTQPPEGGWPVQPLRAWQGYYGFNTQPPEGGWLDLPSFNTSPWFQHTAARRRLDHILQGFFGVPLFQHTAARRRLANSERLKNSVGLFQHTAARRRLATLMVLTDCTNWRFNTQPPEGGWQAARQKRQSHWAFQHTAARRRLGRLIQMSARKAGFQHTAARRRLGPPSCKTQRVAQFQHTAARRRLVNQAL